MYGSLLTNCSFWWIVPVLMLILCFLMMRGRRGSMMCGFGSRGIDNQQTRVPDSAIDILNKRYASGEINKEEYEEKKRTLTESTDFVTD
ncbi:SHOCT domain-containing protein [Thermodesulfobacteriota bacterium]